LERGDTSSDRSAVKVLDAVLLLILCGAKITPTAAKTIDEQLYAAAKQSAKGGDAVGLYLPRGEEYEVDDNYTELRIPAAIQWKWDLSNKETSFRLLAHHQLWSYGWRPESHRFFPKPFRSAVKTLLLCMKRAGRYEIASNPLSEALVERDLEGLKFGEIDKRVFVLQMDPADAQSLVKAWREMGEGNAEVEVEAVLVKEGLHLNCAPLALQLGTTSTADGKIKTRHPALTPPPASRSLDDGVNVGGVLVRSDHRCGVQLFDRKTNVLLRSWTRGQIVSAEADAKGQLRYRISADKGLPTAGRFVFHCPPHPLLASAGGAKMADSVADESAVQWREALQMRTTMLEKELAECKQNVALAPKNADAKDAMTNAEFTLEIQKQKKAIFEYQLQVRVEEEKEEDDRTEEELAEQAEVVRRRSLETGAAAAAAVAAATEAAAADQAAAADLAEGAAVEPSAEAVKLKERAEALQLKAEAEAKEAEDLRLAARAEQLRQQKELRDAAMKHALGLWKAVQGVVCKLQQEALNSERNRAKEHNPKIAKSAQEKAASRREQIDEELRTYYGLGYSQYVTKAQITADAEDADGRPESAKQLRADAEACVKQFWSSAIDSSPEAATKGGKPGCVAPSWWWCKFFYTSVYASKLEKSKVQVAKARKAVQFALAAAAAAEEKAKNGTPDAAEAGDGGEEDETVEAEPGHTVDPETEVTEALAVVQQAMDAEVKECDAAMKLTWEVWSACFAPTVLKLASEGEQCLAAGARAMGTEATPKNRKRKEMRRAKLAKKFAERESTRAEALHKHAVELSAAFWHIGLALPLELCHLEAAHGGEEANEVRRLTKSDKDATATQKLGRAYCEQQRQRRRKTGVKFWADCQLQRVVEGALSVSRAHTDINDNLATGDTGELTGRLEELGGPGAAFDTDPSKAAWYGMVAATHTLRFLSMVAGAGEQQVAKSLRAYRESEKVAMQTLKGGGGEDEKKLNSRQKAIMWEEGFDMKRSWREHTVFPAADKENDANILPPTESPLVGAVNVCEELTGTPILRWLVLGQVTTQETAAKKQAAAHLHEKKRAEEIGAWFEAKVLEENEKEKAAVEADEKKKEAAANKAAEAAEAAAKATPKVAKPADDGADPAAEGADALDAAQDAAADAVADGDAETEDIPPRKTKTDQDARVKSVEWKYESLAVKLPSAIESKIQELMADHQAKLEGGGGEEEEEDGTAAKRAELEELGEPEGVAELRVEGERIAKWRLRNKRWANLISYMDKLEQRMGRRMGVLRGEMDALAKKVQRLTGALPNTPAALPQTPPRTQSKAAVTPKETNSASKIQALHRGNTARKLKNREPPKDALRLEARRVVYERLSAQREELVDKLGNVKQAVFMMSEKAKEAGKSQDRARRYVEDVMLAVTGGEAPPPAAAEGDDEEGDDEGGGAAQAASSAVSLMGAELVEPWHMVLKKAPPTHAERLHDTYPICPFERMCLSGGMLVSPPNAPTIAGSGMFYEFDSRQATHFTQSRRAESVKARTVVSEQEAKAAAAEALADAPGDGGEEDSDEDPEPTAPAPAPAKPKEAPQPGTFGAFEARFPVLLPGSCEHKELQRLLEALGIEYQKPAPAAAFDDEQAAGKTNKKKATEADELPPSVLIGIGPDGIGVCELPQEMQLLLADASSIAAKNAAKNKGGGEDEAEGDGGEEDETVEAEPVVDALLGLLPIPSQPVKVLRHWPWVLVSKVQRLEAGVGGQQLLEICIGGTPPPAPGLPGVTAMGLPDIGSNGVRLTWSAAFQGGPCQFARSANAVHPLPILEYRVEKRDECTTKERSSNNIDAAYPFGGGDDMRQGICPDVHPGFWRGTEDFRWKGDWREFVNCGKHPDDDSFTHEDSGARFRVQARNAVGWGAPSRWTAEPTTTLPLSALEVEQCWERRPLPKNELDLKRAQGSAFPLGEGGLKLPLAALAVILQFLPCDAFPPRKPPVPYVLESASGRTVDPSELETHVCAIAFYRLKEHLKVSHTEGLTHGVKRDRLSFKELTGQVISAREETERVERELARQQANEWVRLQAAKVGLRNLIMEDGTVPTRAKPAPSTISSGRPGRILHSKTAGAEEMSKLPPPVRGPLTYIPSKPVDYTATVDGFLPPGDSHTTSRSMRARMQNHWTPPTGPNAARVIKPPTGRYARDRAGQFEGAIMTQGNRKLTNPQRPHRPSTTSSSRFKPRMERPSSRAKESTTLATTDAKKDRVGAVAGEISFYSFLGEEFFEGGGGWCGFGKIGNARDLNGGAPASGAPTMKARIGDTLWARVNVKGVEGDKNADKLGKDERGAVDNMVLCGRSPLYLTHDDDDWAPVVLQGKHADGRVDYEMKRNDGEGTGWTLRHQPFVPCYDPARNHEVWMPVLFTSRQLKLWRLRKWERICAQEGIRLRNKNAKFPPGTLVDVEIGEIASFTGFVLAINRDGTYYVEDFDHDEDGT
jgi:hypothetical protein